MDNINVSKQASGFQSLSRTPETKEISADGDRTIKTQDCYTSEKALAQLIKAEGSSSDGMSDLSVIRRNLKEGEKLQDATGEFIRILGTEGSNQTAHVQRAHTMIGDSLKPGEIRKFATDYYINLVRAEGSASDGESDYRVVDRNVSSRLTREEGTEEMINLLRLEGSNQTSSVQQHFQIVVNSLKEGEKLKDAVDKFSQLTKTEGCAGDGISDYQVIDNRVSKDLSRKEGTDQLKRLLRLEGSNQTSQVQKDFVMIDGSRKPGESLTSATDQFEKLVRAEGSVSDAVSDYQFVSQFISKDESREQLTDQFIRMLDSVGGSTQTSEAQRAFRQIHEA